MSRYSKTLATSVIALAAHTSLAAGGPGVEHNTQTFLETLAQGGGAHIETLSLGRLGRVTDIASLAVFLASDESAWITGEVIRAAGGLVVAT